MGRWNWYSFGMERIPTQRQSQLAALESLQAFREQIAPIFDERFVTLGHGTRLEVAAKIVAEGLEMKSPALQTTLIGIEGSDEGVRKILNWEHNQAKGIIIVMIPKDLPAVSQEQLLESVERQDAQFGNHWRLPPRFIKGYINAETKTFVPNPAFEESPHLENLTPREQQSRTMEAGVGASIHPAPPGSDSPGDIF